MKTEKHNLFCDLTDHELVQKGEEIVSLYKANSELDMNKKRLSAAIKRNDEDIEGLLKIVDSKQEEREVECLWVWFWEMDTKKLVRLDTFTTVRAEVIKEWERQGKLDEYPEESPSEIELMARQAAAKSDDLPARTESVSDDAITICGNTECDSYSPDEPNHCDECEMVWECDRATAEDTIATAADEEEHARRESICSIWTECEHQNICFTPENEEAGTCFRDEPHKLPSVVDPKAVNRLVHTSVDDCKASLAFVTDLAVLHAALEECELGGQKTKAKHISARINQIEKDYGKNATPTLTELCARCHASNGGCQDCCKTCTDQCNSIQTCRWPVNGEQL